MSSTDSTRSSALPPDPERSRLVVLWEGGSLARPLPAHGTLVIGRGDDCDIVVDHESVSRRHARLDVRGGVTIEDLGSSNGTRVEGTRIAPGLPVPLSPDRPATIGSVVIVLQAGLGAAVAARNSGQGAVAGDWGYVIERVARSDISVILMGETGVGKEVTAERIHARSSRVDRPFLKLNCAAFAESMIESELFGYERGAFTGAHQAKPGLLESAQGGTVFLDEVTELSAATQAKLLRAIENREILRIGSLKPRPIDVRFVSATNQDLEELVTTAGRFRMDLFFRLNGLTVRIPPLRERLAEVEPLARLFLAQAGPRVGRAAPALSGEALARLRRHSWPGNIRELKNVLERAVVLATGDVIAPDDLDLSVFAPRADAAEKASAEPGAAPTGSEPAPVQAEDLKEEMRRVEYQRIARALAQTEGNQTKAARLLGISRKVLISRLETHGFPRPRKPPGSSHQ